MIEITTNPIVLETLKKHFPKPENSAKRALDKYVRLLERQIFDSLSRGRNSWQSLIGLYSISLYKQRNNGGQIGAKKMRLQNWLENNGLELFKVVDRGTNLTGLISQVKLTELVALKNALLEADYTDDGTREITDILNNAAKTNRDLFDYLYPDFDQHTEIEVKELFDIVPIDLASLKNYIAWLTTEATLIGRAKKESYLMQAQTILSVAQHKNGFYYQRKKASPFGRNYYAGISVQNVNKELRRAMLGNCWEYDIRSSVIAWKMGLARECHAQAKTGESFEKTFSMTLIYLADKKDFMLSVRSDTFRKDSHVGRDLQDILLKQAVTAISFGARLSTKGWLSESGEWTNPSIVDIIKNPEERQRFMNCAVIKKFVSEQNLLDSYIFNGCKTAKADFLKLSEVQTFSGRAGKAKVIAYLYQHGETEVMDVVRDELKKLGRTVIANIHDAIIVKKRLGVDNKCEIEYRMQEVTGNKYWHLTAKELNRYETPVSAEEKEEVARHKRFIAEEEQFAKGYVSQYFETFENQSK